MAKVLSRLPGWRSERRSIRYAARGGYILGALLATLALLAATVPTAPPASIGPAESAEGQPEGTAAEAPREVWLSFTDETGNATGLHVGVHPLRSIGVPAFANWSARGNDSTKLVVPGGNADFRASATGDFAGQLFVHIEGNGPNFGSNEMPLIEVRFVVTHQPTSPTGRIIKVETANATWEPSR